MKKVSKKHLVPASVTAHVDDTTDTVAPKWFTPAMQEVLKNYPTKDDLNQKLSGFATKDDLDQRLSGFATKDDLKNMSEHLTGIILHYFDKVTRRFDELDDRFFELFEKNAKAIGNHETRIVSLERRLT